jgi:bisphosphoglycerate-dependent phosphoglycerate mutase
MLMNESLITGLKSSGMPNAPIIAILRHADYNQPANVPSALLPYSLTVLGQRQAADATILLNEFITARNIKCHPQIDTSKMLRAWQTAHIIKITLGPILQQKFFLDEFSELAERSVGAMANLTVNEITNIMLLDPRYEKPPKNWKSLSNYCLPYQDAESLIDAGSRVASYLNTTFNKMAAEGDNRLKIIVGHGASIRHAVMHLGLLSPDSVGNVSMYHATPIFLTKKSNQWRHLDGNFKPRKTENSSDEFKN